MAKKLSAFSDRVDRLERVTSGLQIQESSAPAKTSSSEPDETRSTISRLHARSKRLSSVWYEWFCGTEPYTHTDRKRYHECKVAIGLMRIFVLVGFDVRGDDGNAKARILKSVREAETNIHVFLQQENSKVKSVGTTVRF
ncbi:hypothetical protein Pcac1_g3174 [Phytophthora cactorum]|nr:hypothetical protein Pcac1_g3174 [Phytophthora cactorum]